MATKRTFVDGTGVEWTVFEEDTVDRERDAMTGKGSGGYKLSRCLVFDAPNERRSLCPPPSDWQSAPNERIAEYCQRAETEDVGGQDDLERPT
jgi:hypothetical protein